MSMFKLAFQNFKSSFKSYLSLIISLSFTTIVFVKFYQFSFFWCIGSTRGKPITKYRDSFTSVILCDRLLHGHFYFGILLMFSLQKEKKK